ncbi:MAG: class I SAM-dependent methyltransferase [Actinobacteria bacterium]|nr:class I SAM-dependent methyltransferase [Actinomycetota bacterium]
MDLEEYHARWERLEATGTAAHGEADLIEALVREVPVDGPVLDAGCGMGRVAIELHARGLPVEGVDLDDDLLAYARRDAPHIPWHLGDLAAVQLPRRYGVVAMPGNVMIFCRPEDRAPIVANLAAHLDDGGLLVAGFGLEHHSTAITLDEYDRACSSVGLALHGRYATWERDPFDGGQDAVSGHRRA